MGRGGGRGARRGFAGWGLAPTSPVAGREPGWGPPCRRRRRGRRASEDSRGERGPEARRRSRLPRPRGAPPLPRARGVRGAARGSAPPPPSESSAPSTPPPAGRLAGSLRLQAWPCEPACPQPARPAGPGTAAGRRTGARWRRAASGHRGGPRRPRATRDRGGPRRCSGHRPPPVAPRCSEPGPGG